MSDESAPIVQLVNTLFLTCIKQACDRFYLEPSQGAIHVSFWRGEHELVEQRRSLGALGCRAQSRIRAMANMPTQSTNTPWLSTIELHIGHGGQHFYSVLEATTPSGLRIAVYAFAPPTTSRSLHMRDSNVAFGRVRSITSHPTAPGVSRERSLLALWALEHHPELFRDAWLPYLQNVPTLAQRPWHVIDAHELQTLAMELPESAMFHVEPPARENTLRAIPLLEPAVMERIASLHLHRCDAYLTRTWRDIGRILEARSLTGVRTLRLRRVQNETLQHVLLNPALSALEHLHLHDIIMSGHTYEALPLHTSALTSLTIEMNLQDNEFLLSCCGPSLRHLALPGNAFTDDAVPALVEASPKLETLDLRRNSLTLQGALALLEGLPSLQRLELGSNEVSDDALHALAADHDVELAPSGFDR